MSTKTAIPLLRRHKSEAPLVRRNLSLQERWVSKLGLLRVITEASSDSEIIRRALTVYEKSIDDKILGIRLISRRGTEVIELDDELMTETFSSGTIKRNIILHENSAHRLDALREKTGASSDSDVVRRALRFYERAVAEHQKGGKFFRMFEDGHAVEVTLFYDTPVLASRPVESIAVSDGKSRLTP